MPTNLGSLPICTSGFSVDPSLHDAGSIGPGNCPGSTVRSAATPAIGRSATTQMLPVCRAPGYDI